MQMSQPINVNKWWEAHNNKAGSSLERVRAAAGGALAAGGGDDSMAAIKHTHPWADESGFASGLVVLACSFHLLSV